MSKLGFLQVNNLTNSHSRNSFNAARIICAVPSGQVSGVISNYATDFFKGMSGENQVQIDIVVERTKSKVCKKVTYKGPPEGLKDLPEVIRAASDE